MKRILIIGATGNVGRHVVSQLPAAGVRVRALARNPHTAGFPRHVEVVRGDLGVAATLDEALDGVDAVFLVWAAPRAAVTAALELIVRHTGRIVFLSSPYKTPHPFFQRPQPNEVASLHAEIEGLLETSGREWTFLRPGVFAANALSWWAPQVRAGGGIVRWPYLGAPTAPIDERDIAAVAVRALCEDGHGGAEYLLTGPESLTQREQIFTIGSVLGQPLQAEEIPTEQATQELLRMMPGFPAKLLLDAWAGAMGQPALVTSTVAEITGTPAHTFRDWVIDHAGEFRA